MSSIDEQVIDFYYELFDRIFTQPFQPYIKERLRRDAVARQVQEAAGAASQALTRFFLSEQLTEQQVAEILHGFTSLYEVVQLEHIANPNRTPEALVEDLLQLHPCPVAVSELGTGAVYRVALHLTIQVLMLVGPVMTEWRRLTFSTTYEMPRRIVSQLNQITEGLKAFASAGQAAADLRYEIAYRDHLLQRFYRVEAGTVQMTTSLYVDLRELFVMPHVTVLPILEAGNDVELQAQLMDLSSARDFYSRRNKEDKSAADKENGSLTAIERVIKGPRNVFIGGPGSGKSTFFEWLQLSVANVDVELLAGGAQAIPLLLRVRQLDPKNLPRGARLIEKATASRDRATLMPQGWIERQMNAGRVLVMIDGLDETEPGIRDNYILPWLSELCEDYPDCLYLISSRPVGYPPHALIKLKFAECDLEDFRDLEISEYTRHWCTAIRLAQNEPDEEARREGAKEGEQIIAGFKDHPYIGNLASNPLMLSAICLVNYFEGGELPKDRAKLYRLCVEGLLHHWDQRRGIRSEYSLEEKLRVCCEVAIAMQADDRAEYEDSRILNIFAQTLRDENRAKKLLEHIRYRTGLLVERRSGVFAFAHLTFQEYLAARAVYEGSLLGIDVSEMAREHDDGRWDEVIALYCGLASPKAARGMLKILVQQPDTESLAEVLTEAFLSSSAELSHDKTLRIKTLKRLAIAPGDADAEHMSRFPMDEAAAVANATIGTTADESHLSESFWWLLRNGGSIKAFQLMRRLRQWRTLSPLQTFELVYLLHRHGPDQSLEVLAANPRLYWAPGLQLDFGPNYLSQAEVALNGLNMRFRTEEDGHTTGVGVEKVFLQILRRIVMGNESAADLLISLSLDSGVYAAIKYPCDSTTWPEFVSLTRGLADHIQVPDGSRKYRKKVKELARTLKKWANSLESEIKKHVKKQTSLKTSTKARRRAPATRSQKPSKRRRKA